jgi:hypothetical protein
MSTSLRNVTYLLLLLLLWLVLSGLLLFWHEDLSLSRLGGWSWILKIKNVTMFSTC